MSHIAESFLQGWPASGPDAILCSSSQLRRSLYTTLALPTQLRSLCQRVTRLCQQRVQSSAPSVGSAFGSRARVTRRCGSSVVSPRRTSTPASSGTAVPQMLADWLPLVLLVQVGLSGRPPETVTLPSAPGAAVMVRPLSAAPSSIVAFR